MNNLFYNCDMWLKPVGSGGSWRFTDNIFDNGTFHGDGPVGASQTNAYINMGGSHLSSTHSEGNIDLFSLAYQTGPLGRFYLPAGSSLLGAGSRTAGQASLYHFTSLVNNAKEGNNTGNVNVGPAYLALDVNGNPCDSNAGVPDGIADFTADANGDGTNSSDEVPWSVVNDGQLAISSPVNGAQVSGIVTLRLNPGAGATAVKSVALNIDGISFPTLLLAAGLTAVEFDTRFLANGPHTVLVEGEVPSPPTDVQCDGTTIQSPAITITTANKVVFPAWCNRSDSRVAVSLQAPPTPMDFTLHFLSHGYPKANDPLSCQTSTYTGASSQGAINYSATPGELHYADSTADPAVYSFTELSDGSATANPSIVRDTPWTAPAGYWVTTYADDPVDYYRSPEEYSLDYRVLPPGSDRYWHEGMLWNWYRCGTDATAPDGPPSLVAWPSPGQPQTWPIRADHQGSSGEPGVVGNSDLRLLKRFLADPGVRNFYGFGHGAVLKFLGISSFEYQEAIGRKRFRFVFMDGCDTAKPYPCS